eukprot:Platyproteum_vivax@DN2112_c0_g1_i2.p2
MVKFMGFAILSTLQIWIICAQKANEPVLQAMNAAAGKPMFQAVHTAASGVAQGVDAAAAESVKVGKGMMNIGATAADNAKIQMNEAGQTIKNMADSAQAGIAANIAKMQGNAQTWLQSATNWKKMGIFETVSAEKPTFTVFDKQM